MLKFMVINNHGDHETSLLRLVRAQRDRRLTVIGAVARRIRCRRETRSVFAGGTVWVLRRWRRDGHRYAILRSGGDTDGEI